MNKVAAFLFALSTVSIGTVATSTAEAAMPENLTLPLDCSPGQDCWVVRYVDHDPSSDTKDYACGSMTGDGHQGTDFALRDLATVTSGVGVHAAAAGKVAAVRDGMEDRLIEIDDAHTVGGRECGNGVRIDHGDGWVSLYCHMRRGSPLVMEGDDVSAGQLLGLVGLSGQTSFPHLHFGLRHHDQAVDPFVGLKRTAECGPDRTSLWDPEIRNALDYRRPLFTNVGITAATPDKDDTRKGWHRAQTLPVKSPSLTLWIDGYWFEQGDQVRFLLKGPDQQTVLDRVFELGQPRQRWFSFASAPRPLGGWPRGIYQGEIQVQRAASAIPQTIASTVEIN